MGRLAFIYHPLFEQHNPGYGHPESPLRVKRIYAYLKNNGFLRRLSEIIPQAAGKQQLALIHDVSYIQKILRLNGKEHAILDGGDTVLNAHSVEAALFAAGAGITAVNLIVNQGYDKVFAAVRPPGHHAKADRAMGFCIFNNIAVTARYAQRFANLKKILIIDWDVHHGNGTQTAFYSDPSVFYLSLHQYPFYPMSGRPEEKGSGSGLGFTRNIPLPAGSGDAAYINALEAALPEIEKIFRPQLILISAGFDAYFNDPIGGMQITEEGFYKLTEITARFAQRNCNGRVISFLEGGYHPDGLAKCVYRHLNCLLKH